LPLGRFHRSRINLQPLFIEFEDICDVWMHSRVWISSLDKKQEKESISIGNSEIVDCLECLENIEVYQSSSHEKGKTFQDVNENEHFFTFYCYRKCRR
jgi:hypothetical protein